MVAEQPTEVGAQDLIEFLALIEEHLDHDITLVAAGGTALTLFEAKPSTLDIDFTGPADSLSAFHEAESQEAHGYDIDSWPDGTVFMVNLPDDYLERSRRIDVDLKHVDLRALHPVDLIVTKIARLNQRDQDDIRTTRERFGITVEQVRRRAREITYVGSQEIFGPTSPTWPIGVRCNPVPSMRTYFGALAHEGVLPVPRTQRRSMGTGRGMHDGRSDAHKSRCG